MKEPVHTIREYYEVKRDKRELRMRFMYRGKPQQLRISISEKQPYDIALAKLIEKKREWLEMVVIDGATVADYAPMTRKAAEILVQDMRAHYAAKYKAKSEAEHNPSEHVLQTRDAVTRIIQRNAADAMMFNYVNVYSNPAKMFAL